MELTPDEVWSRVLAAARDRMPEQSYRTWLEGSAAVGITNDEILVDAPSEFHVQWIDDKYGDDLRELLRRVVGRPLGLTLRCATPRSDPPIPQVEVFSESHDRRAGEPARGSPELEQPTSRDREKLNERYTFDRFVVGKNNQLAAAACRAVADKPARMYNPLFLYGGVGLGRPTSCTRSGTRSWRIEPHRPATWPTFPASSS
jgi:chromosomal replication initiator protein